MKKILLVGRQNSIVQGIYNRLAVEYSVQLVLDGAAQMKELMELVRPDLILICVIDFNKEHEDIFKFIKEQYAKVPVLCVGKNEDIDPFREYMDEKQYRVLYRPTTTYDILKQIRKCIDPAEYSDEEKREKQKKILIIDDSAIQLRAMKGLLQGRFKVDIAKSGEGAMKILKRSVPDLIFLDYDMPGYDGKQTMQLIHSYEPTKDVPIVFLTGVKDRQRIQAVLALSPAGYLLKPVDQEKILKIIEEILQEDMNLV